MKFALPGEELATLILRVAVAVGVLAAIWYAVHSYNETITAPVKAQRDSALGSNAAFKAGAEKNNAGIQKRAADGQRRKVESRAAVEKAGAPEAARAKAILEAPCTWGKTDYECANGRFDRELGLR